MKIRQAVVGRAPGALALTRREVLALSGAAVVGVLAPRVAFGAHHEHAQALRAAKQESALVYITPLRADGSESRCQAEVWFVTQGDDVLVASVGKSWRAVSAAREGARARLWVGDFGVWTTSDGAYRNAPSFDARARVDADPKARAYALAAFGQKYPDEWGSWGPRFRKGFEDGTRTLLRYSPE